MFAATADDQVAEDPSDFARSALAMMRGVRHDRSDDELLRHCLELVADRLGDCSWTTHVRALDGVWSLVDHRRIGDGDAHLLASYDFGPIPIGNAESWSTWSPLTLQHGPWPRLSDALNNECVLMPVTFVDGELAGCITVYEPPSPELLHALDDCAMLLWAARTRPRHRALLSERTGQYTALASHSPDVIWRLDAHHRVIYVNRAFESAELRNVKVSLGRHVLDCVPEKARDAWLTALRAITGPLAREEFFYTVGESRFAVRLAPELDEHDRVIGVVATIRDVTKLFQVELQRQAAEVRCQVVSDVTRSVIYERRLSDEVSYVSPSITTTFGYDAREAAKGGLAWWLERVHVDDRARIARMFSSLEGCRETQWAVEFRMKRSDGSWATVIDHGRLLAATEHQPARTVGSVTDVTATRALQMQVHHSHRIELIGRLAGGVAHDFNNVLSAIGGFTELILATTPSTDPRVADLNEITVLVRRATALTQNLLGLSRRRDQAKPVVISVSDAIARLAPTLRTLLGSGVSLAIESIAPELNVLIDPGHFDQILLNLAVNARDAMPDGGTVAINAQLESSRAHDPHQPIRTFARIDVSDRGLGIPPEVLERIFQPYFTTKPEGHGTGLGLSVVHDIVEKAGGTITAASSPADGTTFTVRLPLSSNAKATAETDRPPASAPSTATTALLIEDEEAVRRATKRVLELEGFRVLEARTGDAGVATLLANREGIDVILTDLYMPGLSGPALVERMQRDAPEIGCVVISGHAERFASLTQDSDRLAVLTKPCRGSLLVMHLAEQARGTRERRLAAKRRDSGAFKNN